MSRRLIFVTLLMVLSSGPALAEWVEVSFSQSNGGYSTYADPDSIRRKGSLVKIWELIDFKRVQTFGRTSYLSIKKQSEYECEEERERRLASTAHSENMGGCDALLSDSDPGKWSPVAPDSVGHAMWKLACNKP